MGSNLRAVVRGGRIVLDEPTNLPEGTVLDLVLDDGGDDLDEEQRRALHAAIDASRRQIRDGEGVPAHDVISSLRSRR